MPTTKFKGALRISCGPVRSQKTMSEIIKTLSVRCRTLLRRPVRWCYRTAKRTRLFGRNLRRQTLVIFRRLVHRAKATFKVIFKRLRKSILSAVSFLRHIPGVFGINVLQRTSPKSRAMVVDALLNASMTVETPHGPIRFLCHGRVSSLRASKLMTREPDSLRWIDRIEPGAVFWDIGANIGTLTLYAARRGALKIWSFEPAATNFYQLAANCELNGYGREVQCLQLGFSNRISISNLHVSQFASGRSFSFKTHTDKHFNAQQSVLLWTIDEFIKHYRVPYPNYIKIDVPGLTNDILEGAAVTLTRPEVKQLQIEAPEKGRSGRHIIPLLEKYGFQIVHRNFRYPKRRNPVQRDLVFERTF